MEQPAPEPDPHREIIDFKRYLPTVLSQLVSRLRNSANEFFSRRYGVTLLEWRILAAIASDGPSSAYSLWSAFGFDKAAVSRTLRKMQGRELLRIEAEPGSPRGKTNISLTPEGWRLHDDMLDEIVVRHQRLTGDLAETEIDALLRALAVLSEGVASMEGGLVSPVAAFRPTKIVATKEN